MKISSPKERILSWCEFGAAILMTLCLVALHVRLLQYTGPLWRDEISSLRLATVPTLKEFCSSLVFDPFPILFVVVLRVWHMLGFGDSDFALRALGFLMGCLLAGALWVSCRLINKKWAPLWPLALFALSPVAIHNGDSLRGYGLGLALIVLTFGLIWRFTFNDRHPRTIVVAGIVAVLSVQSLYVNSLALFAICAGGIVILIWQKELRAAALIFAVGLIAALSLLPYGPILLKAHEFSALQSEGNTVRYIVTNCLLALSNYNLLTGFVWIFSPACALAIAISAPLRRRLLDSVDGATGHLLFALTTLSVAAIGTIAFLRILGWLASQYLLPFIAVASLCVHVFAGTLQKHLAIRVANLLGSILIAAMMFKSSYAWSAVRATNCDLAAAAVANRAGPNDDVVVTSFYFGISFQRYYHGAAAWISVPDVADHTQHRWDLVKEVMAKPDPIRNVLAQIESTLRSGQKVFFVGTLVQPDELKPEPLAPAPQTIHGWKIFPYEDNWLRQIVYLLKQHALGLENLSPIQDQPVDTREDLEVFVASGWRESAANSTPP
jgi:hypothetical protein